MGSQVECGTLKLAIPILTHAVCTRCLCTQTKPTKPNLTRTSPAKNPTPDETKVKEMPRNQKPSDKSDPKDNKVTLRNQKPSDKSDPKDNKVTLRNQKPNGINAKCDFPVPLDLKPGKARASSLFWF